MTHSQASVDMPLRSPHSPEDNALNVERREDTLERRDRMLHAPLCVIGDVSVEDTRKSVCIQYYAIRFLRQVLYKHCHRD